mgnify:FL=1|tara:strand:+ start:210 stop:509 length:300 start_codon:yes stop_codon:yes gene_type:complete
MTPEKRFHKHCELEVREWIKYHGGSADCLSWFMSIPEDDRRECVKRSWTVCIDDDVYVSWNDHSYQYFLKKIGAVKERPKQEEEVSMEPVMDDGLNFLF